MMLEVVRDRDADPSVADGLAYFLYGCPVE